MNELLSQPVRNIIECIESWHDENGNWYRIYSDGWCEQGGEYPSTINVDSTGTVTLFKPYINTKYSVITQCMGIASGTSCGADLRVNNRELNQFKITNDGYGVNLSGIIWEAKGYIA